MDVLTGMGVVGVAFVVTSAVRILRHAPTRRAYKELLSMVLHEFKEKHS